ncbi:MAG: hypothetical protein IPN54_06270 [Bacteroidetes bacterium]|nr:hypothetical protein [Bacteroidota bacterium]
MKEQIPPYRRPFSSSSADGIYYIPTVTNQNDGVPIPFKLITSEAGVFVFENPTHDFPTKITYKTDQKNKLSASISGKINGEEKKNSV